MIELTKENAAHFLRAQNYLMKFTMPDNIDPATSIMVDAIDIILIENFELKKENTELKEKIK